jgi:hypothetical protein
MLLVFPSNAMFLFSLAASLRYLVSDTEHDPDWLDVSNAVKLVPSHRFKSGPDGESCLRNTNFRLHRASRRWRVLVPWEC